MNPGLWFGFFRGPQLRIGIRVGRLLRLIGHRLTIVEDFAPYRIPSAAALCELIQEQLRLGAVQSTVAKLDEDGHEYRTVIRAGKLSARALAWLDTQSFPELLTAVPLCFGPRGLHLPPHSDQCFILNAEHEWQRIAYPPEPHDAGEGLTALGQSVVQRSSCWVSSRPDLTVGGYTARTYRLRHGPDGVAEHALALLPSGEVYFIGHGEGRPALRVADGFNNLLAPFVFSVMSRSFVYFAELQAGRVERGEVPLNLVTDHRSATAELNRHIRRHDQRLWLARRFAAGLDRLSWLTKVSRAVFGADTPQHDAGRGPGGGEPGTIEMLFPFLLSLVLVLDDGEDGDEDDEHPDFNTVLVLLDEHDQVIKQTPVPLDDMF